MIRGPHHSGKRLLALAIQRASLLRGEYNQYSVYGQSYETVLDYYRSAGIDPIRFVAEGLLKVVDYLTAETAEPDELESIREGLQPELRDGVIFMPPSRLQTELQEYIREMRAYIKDIGRPGTVIIDSLNERLQQAPVDVVLDQWRRLKRQMSTQSGLLSLHIYTPLGTRIEKEYAEMFHDFEDGIIELRATPSGGHEMRLAMRMPPVIDRNWHPFRIIGTSIVIEKEAEEMPGMEAGLLAGLTGAFVATYGSQAAKWLWEETEELIRRFTRKERIDEDSKDSGDDNGSVPDNLLEVEGNVPDDVGLKQVRSILPGMLNEMAISELKAAKEDVLVFHRRYLKFKTLVAEAGDYAEQREKRNLVEAEKNLNEALFRLMQLAKSMYGES